jgi:hypothetical protein
MSATANHCGKSILTKLRLLYEIGSHLHLATIAMMPRVVGSHSPMLSPSCCARPKFKEDVSALCHRFQCLFAGRSVCGY